MKIGAWIHDADELPLEGQIGLAAENGLKTIRCYSIDYGEKVAGVIRKYNLSLLAGMHVEALELVRDWRSQVRLEELAHFYELGIPLEGICVGNELREGGDEPGKKRFTARLSFGLANVLDAYHRWMVDYGHHTPLTYAMEGIVFDDRGYFNEWLWPLIDACDIVGVNLYPMDERAWFTFGAFDESRAFITDRRARHDRLALFEFSLRRLLQELERAGKPLILTETGFPSAVGYHLEGERLVMPESDPEHYAEAMHEFISLIARVNDEYKGRIQALYFYEWRDNLYHSKIWNVEQSPIHTAFGLCNCWGVPKFDIKRLVESIERIGS